MSQEVSDPTVVLVITISAPIRMTFVLYRVANLLTLENDLTRIKP